VVRPFLGKAVLVGLARHTMTGIPLVEAAVAQEQLAVPHSQ
jgi:hypothetical protein